MSASNNNRNVTRLVLPVFVLGILLSLVLSGVAAAVPSYSAPLIRHHGVKHKAKAKKKKAHKRAARRRARSAAVSVTIDLCAKSGTTTLPGAASVPVWSFVSGTCSSAGPARAVASTLDVGEGDTVTLNVENSLPEALSVDIPGITFNPGSTAVAPGATQAMTFVASNPGTYLYESSGNAGRQSEVGLAGALIVRGNFVGQAYDDADAHSAYTSEHVMVLSEIDLALNAAAAGGTLGAFDMRNWAPTYRLINGDVYEDGVTPSMTAAAGDKVLLRYVNAGSEQSTMTMIGLDAQIVATSASLLTAPVGAVATTFPAGATADSIVSVPTGAGSGDKFPIYDRHLALVNGSGGSAPGGRIRFIEVP